MEGLVSPDFWRARRVLLTGHTGFKGAWLALWLQKLGARVHGLALAPSTEPSLFALANVAQGVDHRVGDIRDAKTVMSALTNAKPEIVFHMAAQSLVRESYRDPLGTLSTNVIGTAHVLEACRRVHAVRAVVIVTSDKCYLNLGSAQGYREDAPLGGDDPYSGSKGAAEIVTHSYRSAFFSHDGDAQVASARAGNVIGGGDWSADRLLPDFFRAVTRKHVLQLRNPDSIRPWQYVLEPLRGYLILAERLFARPDDVAEAWNFGPAEEDSRPVSSVIEKVTALWPEPVALAIDRGPHPKESATLKLDASKAAARLGWHPQIGLDEALQLTTDWYRRVWRDPSVARRCTIEQIENYEACAHA